MGINNNPFGGLIELGVIASGGDPNGDGDHPKDESSNQKVILPGTHDPKNVKQEHLAFSPMMHSPTQHSQQSFQGTLDPGSLVYFLKFPGQNQGVILGQANDLVNYDKNQAGGGAGGGKDLLGDQFFTQLFDRETGVNIPPNIQEGEEKGAKVRKVKDKGKKHKHSLLKGLPSHGATQQTTGYQLPQLKNIPTAKQDFQSIMTNDMGNMMPGNIMSLGSMFSGLMGMGGATGGGGGGAGGAGAGGAGNAGGTLNDDNIIPASFSVTTLEEANTVQGSTANTYISGTTMTRMEYILSNLSPEMQDAINSMSLLVQGMESEGSNGSFALSSTVHAETYLDNATELLSQITSISDLMTVLNRLQWDTELFGQDKLDPIAIPYETTWGSGNQLLYANGDVIMVYANTDAANAEAAFYTVMSSNGSSSSGASSGGASGAPSGTASGGNMFGSGAGSMMDMLKRLTPENADIAKQLMQRVNSGTPEQLMQDVIKKATGGGNPLSFLQG